MFGNAQSISKNSSAEASEAGKQSSMAYVIQWLNGGETMNQTHVFPYSNGANYASKQ